SLVKLLTSGRPSRTLAWRVALHALGAASLAYTVLKSLPWMSKEGSGRITYWDGVPPPKFTIRRLDQSPAASEPAEARRVVRLDSADAACLRR
ncbi:MAG: hypothetical protein WCK05_14205, partial [Planctomycetota bacterium]